MSASEQDHGPQSDIETEASHGGASNYLDHVRSIFSSPDAFFETSRRSERGHALIDLAVYAAAVFMAALFARITGYSGWDFEFGYLIDAVKGVLTIGIALAGAIAGLSVYGNRAGKSHSTSFYIEKLGGGLLLPALLLLLAIPLDLLDIRIHSWFRGLSMAFVYVLIFTLAYRFATAGRLKAAAGFLAGFYALYRLLALLF